ncbi:MAG: hypothetical protein R3D45_04705 [Rhizobiaceae bacterium]
MASDRRVFGRRNGCMGLAAMLLAAMTVPGAAQSWPDINSNVRDDVTGYLCFDPSCTTLRLPNSKCLCQKQNPSERDVRKLRLKCSIIDFGKVEQCPVTPKYGIAE